MYELDVKWMQEAFKEARKAADCDEVPIGAVLVHEGKIIARAHNQVELLQDATAHAEMLCLTMGSSYFENWRLINTTLYCTIEPCVMCAGAMFLSRIKRLVWGAPDQRHGANGSWVNLFTNTHPMHQMEVSSGIMAAECGAILRNFFQGKR